MRKSLVLRVVEMAVVLGATAAAFACSDDDPPNYAGAAAQATAKFWTQEAAAGTLPEGTIVEATGTKEVVELEIPSDAAEGTQARFCVEFQYIRAQSPFETHIRVYETTLIDDLWNVTATSPDGRCDPGAAS
jgi:hypothetical protein